MSEISRVALFGKLNSLGYKAIESATVFCKLRGNPYVEVVHWFHQILQQQDSDLHRIVRDFQLDPGAAGQEHDRGARPPAARRDVDLRSVVARRGGGRARLGLRQPDVRRRQGPHRPPAGRHAQDAGAAQRAARASRASSRRSASTA